AATLAEIGRRFYSRGWVLGTSGNFSAVTARDPLRLAITPSGASKGALTAGDLLQCDEHGELVGGGSGKPSAETLLHVEIATRRRGGAVLDTHSIWSTLLSDSTGLDRGLTIHGYEMLKGLSAVTSHEHREWIPILENDQDMRRLAEVVGRILDAHRDV